MTRSESIAALAAALSKCQAEVSSADKTKLNPAFKSKYADLASVWDACRAPLSKNGLSVVQLPQADGAKVTVTTMLMHSSGEWICTDLTVTAQAVTPVAVGSAITYARRYSLSAIVGVAPDDDDGTAASARPGPAQRSVAPHPMPAVTADVSTPAARTEPVEQHNTSTGETADSPAPSLADRFVERITVASTQDDLAKLGREIKTASDGNLLSVPERSFLTESYKLKRKQVLLAVAAAA